MSPTLPRALLVTFAIVSLVTAVLATICAVPSAGIRPVRNWVLDFDEPAPSAR